VIGRRSAAVAGVLALLLVACPEDPLDPDPEPEVVEEEATPDVPAEPPEEPPDEPEEPEPAEPVEIEVTVVATNLEVPWEAVFTPDGRTYVTERDSGRLLELQPPPRGGQRADTVMVEVQRFPINPAGEGGLLGLAVSPDFDDDGLLYAYYTTDEDNRIVRFRPGEEPQPVLTGIPRGGNHNGGRIAFGPDDGMLYAGTGDAGVPQHSQDPGSLGGKILRMTPDGEVADGNPRPDSLVYALGLRNVQGLAWDAGGRLFATEFGPAVDDEINLVEPGANYGWPHVTGEAGHPQFVDPVLVRQPPEASWSGAAVLLDGAIPQWEGHLFAAALRGQRLWRVEPENGAVAGVEELLAGEFGRLRQVVQTPDGSLWVLTSNRDGRGRPVPEDDRIIRLGPPEG
jgi:glucose/arabinose dehydrogenase